MFKSRIEREEIEKKRQANANLKKFRINKEIDRIKSNKKDGIEDIILTIEHSKKDIETILNSTEANQPTLNIIKINGKPVNEIIPGKLIDTMFPVPIPNTIPNTNPIQSRFLKLFNSSTPKKGGKKRIRSKTRKSRK